MKANELRLGNYFQSNIIQKVQIEHLEFLLNDKFDHSGMQPIPLSEEWLFKMGFETYLNGYRLLNSPKYTEIQITKKGFYTDKKLFDYELDYNKANESQLYISVFYIHQLQNLYFSLCGVELEIK